MTNGTAISGVTSLAGCGLNSLGAHGLGKVQARFKKLCNVQHDQLDGQYGASWCYRDHKG